ncbi:MAG: PEP-CTERM sorting domain-containing protein [Planctomycetia bacterium]|nr:PEP-CTERM sorting domain-containing protein [Planctomycetia bacterium]
MLRLIRATMPTLLFSCWLSTTAFAQNFVVNGTFNDSVPSNGTGGSWTSSTIGSGGWAATGGNPGGCFTLNENGFFPDPRIEQTITGLSIGQSYTVTGDYQIHVALGNPANSFGVLLDSNTLLQLGNPGATWTPFTVNFVATSSSHLIAFEAERNGSDHSYMIDNISVVAVVPEPASWAMIVLGISGMTALSWKSKNRRYLTML